MASNSNDTASKVAAPEGDAHGPFNRKTFIPLENNPIVMNHLAHRLGLSPDLAFQDVYSLTDPDLLALLPRPCPALLFIFPMTGVSDRFYLDEDAQLLEYDSAGPSEPVLWYKQTIRHACGLIGLLHCITNGPTAESILPNSSLSKIMADAIPLKPKDRSQLLYDSEDLEAAHADAALKGDTIAPDRYEYDDPYAFVAFVKGKDGHLWELEGRRKGPLDRGALGDDDDVLSEKALEMGPLAYLKREEKAGNGEVRFSCVALGPTMED